MHMNKINRKIINHGFASTRLPYVSIGRLYSIGSQHLLRDSFRSRLTQSSTYYRKLSDQSSNFTTKVGPPPKPERKMTSLELQHMRRKGQKIAMITAYDYPTGRHAEQAGFDIVLVGDSLGMVVLGYDTTQPVTMDDMIRHCQAVRRGAPTRFIVGDMPYGSYEISNEEALRNAYRLVKECNVDAVKLEGGASRADTVRKLVDGGVSVMGHIGLMPQGVSVLGGFRAQGRTAVKARSIVDDAIALQNAGAFALVIECVPAIVAKAVTENVKIPVIGIGAGPHTTGQVLVYHDLLGLMNHPHHEKYVPTFCKRYAVLGNQINEALLQYANEVREGVFPDEVQYSPYTMTALEEEKFTTLMKIDEKKRHEEKLLMEKKLTEADEYAATKLY